MINATLQIWRTCCGWGGCRAWIAPPETRKLRELVRYRAKLVAMRSQCKAHVYAVLAKGGIWVPMTDLFGVEGNLLLDRLTMPAPYKARIVAAPVHRSVRRGDRPVHRSGAASADP
jgi:hypothetical protein